MPDTSHSCGYCGTLNESDARFCRTCGHRLPLYYRCFHCQNDNNMLPVKYCSHCGERAPDVNPDAKLILLPYIDGDEIGYMDYHTRLVYVQPKFKFGKLFSEGYAAVKTNYDSGWVFIDESGTQVILEEYRDCSEFKNGLAIVDKNHLKGVINTSGNVVLPCEYSNIIRHRNGCFFAEKGEHEYLFDPNCKLVFESRTYSFIVDEHFMNLYEDIVQIYDKDTKLSGLMNLNGDLILTPKYTTMKRFSEGLCAVSRPVDGVLRWGFINTEGTECISCKFQEVDAFHSGVANFREYHKKNDGCVFPYAVQSGREEYFVEGLIDVSGKIVVEPGQYILSSRDSDGLIRCDNEKSLAGFLNSKGEEAIPCQYKRESAFWSGFSIVQDSKEHCGVIDQFGDTVIPFEYDYSSSYFSVPGRFITNDGFFILIKDGRYGVIDKGRMIIIPFDYDEIRFTDKGYFIVRKGKQYGLMNHKGSIIIPFGNHIKIEAVHNSFGFELYRVYSDRDNSGILDIDDTIDTLRVPCLFFYINDDQLLGTDTYDNPHSLDGRFNFIFHVRMRNENRQNFEGEADLFGNYRLRKE